MLLLPLLLLLLLLLRVQVARTVWGMDCALQRSCVCFVLWRWGTSLPTATALPLRNLRTRPLARLPTQPLFRDKHRPSLCPGYHEARDTTAPEVPLRPS